MASFKAEKIRNESKIFLLDAANYLVFYLTNEEDTINNYESKIEQQENCQ